VHLEVDVSGDNPRGYLLLNIEGTKARAFARAFYETFGRFVEGTGDEKKQAEVLLNNFLTAVRQEWTAKR
jgi:hypothetical protein